MDIFNVETEKLVLSSPSSPKLAPYKWVTNFRTVT